MTKKTIYLLTLICGFCLISSARQQCSGYRLTSTAIPAASVSRSDAVETKKGYDLSPVGFFVLNM